MQVPLDFWGPDPRHPSANWQISVSLISVETFGDDLGNLSYSDIPLNSHGPRKKNSRILSMNYWLLNSGMLIFVYEIMPT